MFHYFPVTFKINNFSGIFHGFHIHFFKIFSLGPTYRHLSGFLETLYIIFKLEFTLVYLIDRHYTKLLVANQQNTPLPEILYFVVLH